jgi:multicomponent Na+:H+ antiporter subunit F
MFDSMLSLGAFFLMFMIFACLYRAAMGPRAIDRIISINMIGTKAVVIIAIISFVYDQHYYLDIAMVYALISYITIIGIGKYFEIGRLN